MPPKSQSVSRSKKARTGKTSAAVDVLSTDEMSKQQLEDHVIRLREELDREREERSFFQLERDKIQSFWEVCKRNLEETKAELRNRSREQEEAEERHRVEITVYKQKLKHVLSEQHGAAVETAMDGGVAAWLTRKGHTEGELRLRGQSQKLQADAREKQLNTSRNIQELQLHEVELMELSKDYDRRLSELEAKYHKKMESTRRAESDRTQAAILQLEDKVSQRVEVLLERHDRTFRGAEEFYSATQSKLLADHKLLQEDLAQAKQQQARVDRQLSEALRRNKGLQESLQEAQRKLPELCQQLEAHERARSEQAAGAARVKRLEQQLSDMSLERDGLLQVFTQVEEERDALLRKQTEVLLDMQQRSGLKEMLLDQKLALLTESVDKKEAQLLATLSSANIHPAASAAATTRLEDTLRSKRVAIKNLQEELDRQVQEYNKTLQRCREQLEALSVPSYDFLLTPAELILSGQKHPEPAR
ncbi:dynein regulatory complex subunit 4-like isoform X2 [Nerophis ophidion]|uniref:dynein regulatory complex subunit 4-like isoform X2 n=1 Tax=Nerophis ophidion TaxID=159077 RepID=UPI002AE0B24C|nr:dynein regulatory complex subunit 4-like isoform X2 [Nerophis ophidion]